MLPRPERAEEVQANVRVAAAHGRSVVPRGAGTGAAVPLGAPVVVVTTRMNKIPRGQPRGPLRVGRARRRQPRPLPALRPLGFHFAPDPSSQQACTIGGNVSTNSGGPHCLAYGVTTQHIFAVEVVLSDGELVMLGGLNAEPAGLELRGALVGGEGMLGIVTRCAVRLTPNPPAVRTLLLAFSSIGAAASTVSAVIAAGIVPATMEVMDRRITEAVENFVSAGYPTMPPPCCSPRWTGPCPLAAPRARAPRASRVVAGGRCGARFRAARRDRAVAVSGCRPPDAPVAARPLR